MPQTPAEAHWTAPSPRGDDLGRFVAVFDDVVLGASVVVGPEAVIAHANPRLPSCWGRTRATWSGGRSSISCPMTTIRRLSLICGPWRRGAAGAPERMCTCAVAGRGGGCWLC